MTESNGSSEQRIRCTCGATAISHAFDDTWECEACGRFHDVIALDRLADKTWAREGRD